MIIIWTSFNSFLHKTFWKLWSIYCCSRIVVFLMKRYWMCDSCAWNISVSFIWARKKLSSSFRNEQCYWHLSIQDFCNLLNTWWKFFRWKCIMIVAFFGIFNYALFPLYWFFYFLSLSLYHGFYYIIVSMIHKI